MFRLGFSDRDTKIDKPDIDARTRVGEGKRYGQTGSSY